MASTEALTRTIKELTTETHKVTLPSGKEVQVYVCKTKHLPILLRLLSTVFEPLNLKLSTRPKPGEIAMLLDDVGFLLNLVAANFPLIVEAARTLTELNEDDVQELDIDDLVAVIDGIIRRNYDFFTQRLLPALEKYLPAQLLESVKATEVSTTAS